ncbi:hypothetical protein QZH41_009920 [Actinostola sp. cb2023]|nr:hypothetical protein QZH41_009920 [Actinostola sp. cb2023]
MAEVDSAFEFLHMEIVNYIHRERQGKFIENDTMQILERMGYNVGQKLVERLVLLRYLAFSCGLIRGGLANLGVVCSVTSDILPMPACKKLKGCEMYTPIGDLH